MSAELVATIGAAVVVAALLVANWRMNRGFDRFLRGHAQEQLDILGHLRRTMEDLRDRDPVIAESVEVALLELAWSERYTRALAEGRGLVYLARLRAEHRRDTR